jgi:hypothetical protein
MRPVTTTTTVPLLVIVSTLIAAGGCRPDFAPYNRLTGLRVLAIQSDPPTPNTGETATLSALVFAPVEDPTLTVDPTLTYEWSWCPYAGTADQGYPCLITEDQVAMVATQLGQVTPVAPFNLGTAATATLPNSIDRPVLQALCAGGPGAPAKPNCTGGFPIQVRLMVRTDKDMVDTVYTTRWRFDDETAANALPIIDAVNAVIGDTPQAIDDQAAVTLPRNVATQLRAVVAMEQAESFVGVDENGQVVPQVERLFLTWFVEAGGTDDSRTSYIAGSTDFADLLKNTWSPPLVKDYKKDKAHLSVVIHDSRGGISWRTGIVQLEPSP